jgi:hypothetical protein
MKTKVYRVKFRNLHSAKRNPFRPSQKIKRGPWVADQTFYDDWPAAKERCEFMHRGFREAAIFVGGKIHRPNEFTGRLPAEEPEA